ncbi:MULTISPECIES: sigma-70 family RNA polymerase sigma factor [Fusobacterium]|jgi:RNA polymerase sporulation-specific sigma factor|uniref:RNA polymerase sigma factor SigS n=2 Tax=Fusobacterium mortiferum TaxID=850 RepID=A0A414PP31_FUSMR|nr:MULTISPECIES: sigma-70 family RNA polymerase sigma factor [Fusobacterium]AVQ20052.1 RNA polymerase subunit sigma-70 [Fusobacterium mortiferum ATCC 9817]EEO36725.2 RNA polymerase factor sigma-70 [Fusobacterium mortiferum ATCC 9817]MCF2628450.1 sigma-70 family RNA polymerase sigma factor [Fusobacterium mortiferum]MCF2700216.1 sigma-70 family RNA polymerase sigma factor [Fusobacterium mortiferum]MCI6382699.1 sigma-70 family RNA polymerase sigma factor [Fusobacterium mortiferum]
MNEELINDEVIKLAQNGDQEALDLILKEYKKLIYLNIRNYFLVGADQDDLLQEGTIGLLKAIKNYSEGKASFKTFATLCIRRQILTAVRSSTAQKNSALNEASGNNLETEDGHEDYPKELYSNVRYNPEAIFLSKEKIMEFQDFVEHNFSPFERQVFNYMIKGFSYKEIAEELEKTPKVIDNSFQRIKRKSELWLSTY